MRISTDRQVRAAGPGRHGVDGAGVRGLMLVVAPTGARSWVQRLQCNSRRHDFGLGSYPSVGLASAREKSIELRRAAKAGESLITTKKAPSLMTMAKAVTAYARAHGDGWSNPRYAKQWLTALEQHVLPGIGDVQVANVTSGMIEDVLRPIWVTTHQTASRLRQRLEVAIDYADTREGRSRANPARWRGALKNLLPSSKAIRKTRPAGQHLALPWQEAPALVRALAEDGGTAARALLFALHVAGRSNEILQMSWGEVDDATLVWTLAPERMKARRLHEVPLTVQARSILGTRGDPGRPVFLGPRSASGCLTEDALRRWLRRSGWSIKTSPHGLRSCFRVWVSERTNFQPELAEHALAHQVGTATGRAYDRTTMLEPRRPLMRAWSEFLTKPIDDSKVVPITQRG